MYLVPAMEQPSVSAATKKPTTNRKTIFLVFHKGVSGVCDDISGQQQVPTGLRLYVVDQACNHSCM